MVLEVDGRQLAPEPFGEHDFLFRLALPATTIALRSPAARPVALGSGDDRRLLGLQLFRLEWRQGAASHLAPLDLPDCGDGFHEWEELRFRWTNGCARLGPALLPPWQGEVTLWVRALSWLDGDASAPASPAPWLRQFESLGVDCEFGFVQRHFDVTPPLGLFRWGGTDRARLLRGLRNSFAGIALPEHLALVAGETDWRLETPYVRLHSFHTIAGTTPESAEAEWRPRAAALLGLMRRKLLHDIAAGSRLFVFKATEPDFGRPEMRELHAALGLIGPAPLLCVTAGEHSAPVRRLAPGLYHGQLSGFVLGSGPYDEWLALCRQARALHWGDDAA
jgi:hypothetical protein